MKPLKFYPESGLLTPAQLTELFGARTIQTENGLYPCHDGKPLSWVLSETIQDANEGYPRLRAVIRAMKEHRPKMLAEEKRQLIKSSLCDRVFGQNAERILRVIESEVGK